MDLHSYQGWETLCRSTPIFINGVEYAGANVCIDSVSPLAVVSFQYTNIESIVLGKVRGLVCRGFKLPVTNSAYLRSMCYSPYQMVLSTTEHLFWIHDRLFRRPEVPYTSSDFFLDIQTLDCRKS